MNTYEHSYCQGCNRNVPTASVTFMQNIGALVMRFSKTVTAQLCRSCCDDLFWKMTAITFFFGWWGVISFFYTLVALPVNVVSFIKSRSLPKADAPQLR